jgi:hypothetical protein
MFRRLPGMLAARLMIPAAVVYGGRLMSVRGKVV